MAVASPALPLASTDAQAFTFSRRTVLNVQVRFYLDAAGTVPIAAGTGSRDLTATNVTPVFVERVAIHAPVENAIDGGTRAGCVGGTWYLLGLGGGLQQANIAASGGVDPGGAASYRIVVDVEATP